MLIYLAYKYTALGIKKMNMAVPENNGIEKENRM